MKEEGVHIWIMLIMCHPLGQINLKWLKKGATCGTGVHKGGLVLIWNHLEERVLWHLKHWIDRYKQWDHPHVECFVIWKLANGLIVGAKGVPLLQN